MPLQSHFPLSRATNYFAVCILIVEIPSILPSPVHGLDSVTGDPAVFCELILPKSELKIEAVVHLCSDSDIQMWVFFLLFHPASFTFLLLRSLSDCELLCVTVR